MDTVPRMVGVPQLRRLRRRICGDVEGNRASSGSVDGHRGWSGGPQLRHLRRRICGDVEGNRALNGAVGGHSASRAMSFIAIC